MVVVAHPDSLKYSDDPKKAEKQRKAARARYRVYKQAQFVWRQISEEERVWLLRQFGYRNPEEASANDANHDLRELRLQYRHLRKIRDYPRSEHRRAIYRQKLAEGPPRKDVRVRKHEKRLRERGA